MNDRYSKLVSSFLGHPILLWRILDYIRRNVFVRFHREYYKNGTHISKSCINNGFKSLESCEVNIVLTAIAVNEGISISTNGNPLEYLIWTTKVDYIYLYAKLSSLLDNLNLS